MKKHSISNPIVKKNFTVWSFKDDKHCGGCEKINEFIFAIQIGFAIAGVIAIINIYI